MFGLKRGVIMKNKGSLGYGKATRKDDGRKRHVKEKKKLNDKKKKYFIKGK
jgi:hypothetical protein